MTYQLVCFRRDDGGGERSFALPGHLPSPGDRVRIGVDMDLFEVTGIEHAIMPAPVEGDPYACKQVTCVRIMPVAEGQPPSCGATPDLGRVGAALSIQVEEAYAELAAAAARVQDLQERQDGGAA